MVVGGVFAAIPRTFNFVNSPQSYGWASEKHIATVCSLCPGGCGITVRTWKNRAIRIYGNPINPVNQGGVCPRGLAGLHVLYNPDRVKFPMKQQKGTGNWQRISWEEAIKTVAEKLGALRSKGGAHTLAAMTGDGSGLMHALIERFMRAFGSRNLIDFSPNGRFDSAVYLMQGIKSSVTYDISKSAYVISFNSDFLDNSSSPVGMMRAYGEFRSAANKLRGKLVHAGPRLSMTATKADEWITIKPNTEGAFALGIIHVLIKERLLNDRFLSEHAAGFAEFRSAVLRYYEPVMVSELTGVPAETVIRIAREFSRMKPSVAIPAEPDSMNYQDIYTRMAIHALNAVVGSIDSPGGVITPRALPAPFEPFEPDEAASAALRQPSVEDEVRKENAIVSSVCELGGRKFLASVPYKPKMIMLFEANPVYDSIYGQDYRQLLLETEFVVSFSSFLDETTQCADIVLPNHTYLERWGDCRTYTIGGMPVVGLQQPVVQPFYETRHTGDVLIELAKKLGGGVAGLFEWENFKEILDSYFEKIYAYPRGDVFGSSHEAGWASMLERSGWKASSYAAFEDFWNALTLRGGWWDPIYYCGEWNRVIKTKSGAIEFSAPALARLDATKDEADMRTLPHFRALDCKINANDFPLHLNVFTPLAFHNGFDSNLPYLQDISGIHVNAAWKTWVEISHEDAEKAGIHNNDNVVIESPRGKIHAIAKVFRGAVPGIVSVPFGLGRKAEGRWQKDVGQNVADIVDRRVDSITGDAIWSATRVRVYKA